MASGTIQTTYRQADINSKLNNLLTVTSVSATASVAGSSSSGELTKAISNTGYTALGIVGYSLSGDRTTFCILARAVISGGTTIKYILRNTNATATGTDSTITFYVLWRKNN